MADSVVPRSRRLLAGLSKRRPWFSHRPMFVRFVVHKMALGRVCLRVSRFSPVSTIPPTLHTHSSIYHQRCIMFLSQYFSFPQSLSFHERSTLILIYMLLLSEGQTGVAWEPAKRNAREILVPSRRKVL
jgi:hypothetical protein